MIKHGGSFAHFGRKSDPWKGRNDHSHPEGRKRVNQRSFVDTVVSSGTVDGVVSWLMSSEDSEYNQRRGRRRRRQRRRTILDSSPWPKPRDSRNSQNVDVLAPRTRRTLRSVCIYDENTLRQVTKVTKGLLTRPLCVFSLFFFFTLENTNRDVHDNGVK